LNWQNVPLQRPDGQPFDLLAALRSLPEAQAGDFPVQTAPDPAAGLPAIPGRLVAIRKSEPAAAYSRAHVWQGHNRQGYRADWRTVETAAYVFVFTNHPTLPAGEVLEWYRFRWQIEMTFKRLKGLLTIDEIAARDLHLARSYLYAKLLLALLLEDLTARMLAFSPWGLPPGAAALPVADAAVAAG
jgi:hypothetical protein